MSDVPETPGAGGFDISSLLEQVQGMSKQLMDAQQKAADQVIEGVSGGGMVKVEVTGTMEFRSVHIDPKVVDPSDVEMLEDLVLAAIHDAAAKAAAVTQQSMGNIMPGGMGGLGGLLG